MQSQENDPIPTNPPGRRRGRSGEGGVTTSNRAPKRTNRSTFGPLPGLQAYRLTAFSPGEGSPIPGFGARTYRDSGRYGLSGRFGLGTGISGMAVPGFEAQGYRDSGHPGAGTWGMNGPAFTGIASIFPLPNPLNGLNIQARNFVSSNSCHNSSTVGERFLSGGRGPWPGRE